MVQFLEEPRQQHRRGREYTAFVPASAAASGSDGDGVTLAEKGPDTGRPTGVAAPGFTPSQREAFQAICTQKVTAVWGPPGTGKTHFLASTILALDSAHAKSGQPFRVLVTAFTHAAIENLLRKIAESLAAADRGGSVVVFSWTQGQVLAAQSAPADVATVNESDLGGWVLDQEHIVLGATSLFLSEKARRVWPASIWWSSTRPPRCAMPESAIAAHLVAETGRLVLAGDHLQLPPIVAGRYPETPPGEPLLHRSIFEAVCPRLPAGALGRVGTGSRLVRQLLENFRMNDVLTSFAAHLLYGPRYHCGSSKVARRRLTCKMGRGARSTREVVSGSRLFR